MSLLDLKQIDELVTSMEEMRIKENAPSLSRPSSPDRKAKKHNMTLADIPEATPGPNAFAQQAARIDRHRLDGNAFYQQEVQRRKVTPPTDVHPALRERSSSAARSPPRESSCTTISTFIHAGNGKHHSPDLKLVPSNASMALPTDRALLEERHEQMQHERSGSRDERIPVFIPTPKIVSQDFAEMPPPIKSAERGASAVDLTGKTPKKGLFERLKITTNFRGASTTTLGSMADATRNENIPVKAQAVLGASPRKPRTSLGSSPPKSNIIRSPSKRKGLFSRKESGSVDAYASSASLVQTVTTTTPATASDQPTSATTVVFTPQTSYSDPTHYSYDNKRNVSQSTSDKGRDSAKSNNTCMITRSQSLKYFDHAVPPTPPAKNTPPDEKARREAAQAKTTYRIPFQDDRTTLPKDSEGLVSTDGRISPTRFGSYGHRETPRLVTQPSVYSLHASVVPNMTEASTLEEMKARIDGLGLEGFSLPPENTRSPKSYQVYSPSIYSTDWAAREHSAFAGATPPLPHVVRHSLSPSTHTKKSSSSGGEIQICYPELAKDPSLHDLSPSNNSNSASASDKKETLHEKMPWKGNMHRRNRSDYPRHSRDSTVFAEVDEETDETFYDSPTSFSHPSATPSPLAGIPSTVYTPPPRKDSKLPINNKSNTKSTEPRDEPSGLGISNHTRTHTRTRTPSTSPSRTTSVFENAPSFSTHSRRTFSRSPSPQVGFNAAQSENEVDVDPKKPSLTKDPSSDKLDRMIEMLNTLNTRNAEITSMRDEMRETNSRLDKRLALMESVHSASPGPPGDSDDHVESDRAAKRTSTQRDRVATKVAYEFYGKEPTQDTSTGEDEDVADPTESTTIAELKETNRRLLEMVGGFAEKIQALEKKAKRQK